jgi:hypothetical protein
MWNVSQISNFLFRKESYSLPVRIWQYFWQKCSCNANLLLSADWPLAPVKSLRPRMVILTSDRCFHLLGNRSSGRIRYFYSCSLNVASLVPLSTVDSNWMNCYFHDNQVSKYEKDICHMPCGRSPDSWVTKTETVTCNDWMTVTWRIALSRNFLSRVIIIIIGLKVEVRSILCLSSSIGDTWVADVKLDFFPILTKDGVQHHASATLNPENAPIGLPIGYDIERSISCVKFLTNDSLWSRYD